MRVAALALALALSGCGGEAPASVAPSPEVPAPHTRPAVDRPGAERTLDRMLRALDTLRGTLDEGPGAP